MSRLWYYAEGNETRGPITLVELIGILSRLSNAARVLVWRDGFDDWKAAGTVREIAERIIRPPPLKAQPPFVPEARVQTEEPIVEASETVEAKALKPELTGIGGWLVFIAIGQILGLIKFLASIAKYYSSADLGLLQQFPAALYGEAILFGAEFGFFAYTAKLFFQKSRKFPRFFIYQWVIVIVSPLIVADWDSMTVRGAEFANFIRPGDLGAMVAAAIGAAIWIPYILRSRRVANTFIK